MGAVWRAEHIELGTPAAVKLISREIAGNEEALSRFKREAQAAATLRSPHVVQILFLRWRVRPPRPAKEPGDGGAPQQPKPGTAHRLGHHPRTEESPDVTPREAAGGVAGSVKTTQRLLQLEVDAKPLRAGDLDHDGS